MSNFSKRFAALSPQQRELLAMRLKEKGMDIVLPAPESSAGAAQSGAYAEGKSTDLAKSADLAIGELAADKPMQFSIFFFSGDGSATSREKYRLLIDSARFADAHGFSAVWTPERHFQDFGGLYPNPSVLSAALAIATERIQIRAGSVALPLHHPVRVAEEWSLVDNLSNGRVAISVASGWHPDDFILAPEIYESRKEVMFDYIQVIRKLWAGEPVTFSGAQGREVSVRILPRPLQPELPIWVTTAGSPQTWTKAGEVGANVLAALIGYSFEHLAELIRLYREARARGGHDPESGIVTLMLHTFIGDDNDAVKQKVRAPMQNYLRTYMKQQENVMIDPDSISEADKEALVAFAFENYFETATLLGTADKCARTVDRLIAAGVDEIACLIDFGLDIETIMEGLERLSKLKELYHRQPAVAQS